MSDAPVRVWDLPTRLFHWALVGLVVASFVTAKLGGNLIQWHFWSGYAILALVLFRFAWGFAGGRYARFGSFLFGPRDVLAAARGSPQAPRTLGHNPLGAVSVFAMLGLVALQALAGLFSNDDIASEGPLARYVSKALSDRLTGLHHLNEKILLVLVALHVAAILFYLLRRRENLVRPMLTGDKAGGDPEAASRDDAALRLRALLILGACAAAVWLIVGGPAR